MAALLPNESPSPPAPFRRVYGRGLFDGLRMAGIDNPEEFLNEAKLQRTARSINGVARKVLDTVPISEPWTISQVSAEMLRATGSRPEFKIVAGCLDSLASVGLIREPTRGSFIRVMPKRRPELASVPLPPAPLPAEQINRESPSTMTKLAITKPSIIHEAAPSAAPVDPLERIAQVATALRSASVSLAEMAQELDDAALVFTTRLDQVNADTEKLRQLQAILKSIGQ